jgi:hypothetical protein
MERALQAWLRTASRSNDPVAASRAAAEAVSSEPWAVVHDAGRLARARLTEAPQDLGLTIDLGVRVPGHPDVVATVEAGAPYPAEDRRGRRLRGAFDTPAAMALDTVTMALNASARRVRRGIDPACGSGAFLVALAERGVREIQGVELDPAVAAVANVAAPHARIDVGDGMAVPGEADIVVGNPPFVPPERQDKALRAKLRETYPWLVGRFDLAVPFSAAAIERAHPGGAVALVLPAPMMVQPYARPLRRHWAAHHRIHGISAPRRFPGAMVDVVTIAMTIGRGPAPFPNHGLPAESLLLLDQAPFNPRLQPGDPELVARIRAQSIELGELCEVDTGVVSHGKSGGKDRLISDTPQPGWKPYVDARDLHAGRRRWLNYTPAQMHRPKRPALFEGPKVLVQRLRGAGPVRAWMDEDGLFAGHTLTVVRPVDGRLSIARLHTILTDPLTDALFRIERGDRLDLYPRDIRATPVPIRWLSDATLGLGEAWGLTAAEIACLRRHMP